jgi:hypothetical protein
MKPWSLLTEAMLHRLSSLNSFVIPRDEKLFAQWLLSEDDELIGVYVNDPENFILFCEKALHWVYDDNVRVIPFSSITSVELPDDDNTHALVLKLIDGSVTVIEIQNNTVDYPDVHELHDILKSMIYFPHFSYNTEDILKIKTRGDLREFLHQDNWDKYSAITSGLYDGFPQKWLLERFNIDPALLEREDIWRLLALFVSHTDLPMFDEPLTLSSSKMRAAYEYELVTDSETEAIGSAQKELSSYLLKQMSPGTRAIISSAEELAKNLGNNLVSVDILLLALLEYDQELTRSILDRSGLTTASLRELIVQKNVESRPKHQLAFGNEVVSILDDAHYKKMQTDSETILPADILTAIAASDDPSVIGLLNKFGQ